MTATDLRQIQSFFKGDFIVEPAAIYDKLVRVKAYVFDWDGVFNSGEKNESGCSSFNEVDSMGINMLRFNHFLRSGHNPIVAVISGEKNCTAFKLAQREHFHAVYYKIGNKKEALTHFCRLHNLQLDEVAFFFDDVLDLSVSMICGLRVMVGKDCNPLFKKLVKEKQFADYITHNDGGDNSLREAVELLMGLSGRYDDTIMQRVAFSEDYSRYLAGRNAAETIHFTSTEPNIIERSQQ